MTANAIQPLSTLLESHAFPLFSALKPVPGHPVHVAGLAGSSLSALVAARFHAAKGNVLVLTPDVKGAETLVEDLLSWLPEDQVAHFPGLDLKPYEWREPFGQTRERRLECFDALYRGQRLIFVTTVTAFLEKLPAPENLHREIVELRPGDSLNPALFREQAMTLGFQEEGAVRDIGEFSVRGEILDIYPFLAENPYRIVLHGDTVETIKEFDIFSQRSVRAVPKISLFPLDECCYASGEIEAGLARHRDRMGGEDSFRAESIRLLDKRDLTGIHWQKAFFKAVTHTLLDFLGPEAGVVIAGTEGVGKAVEKAWAAALEGHADALARGRFVNTPDEIFLRAGDLARQFASRPVIHTGNVAWEGPGSVVFEERAQERGGGGISELEPEIHALTAEGIRVYLLCGNEGQAEHLRKVSSHTGIDGVLVGHLTCGFVDRGQGLALFTDHQIYNRFSRNVRKRKHRGGGAVIPNFDALNRGDFVVHENYGVGKFIGIKRIEVMGHEVDCILLDYRGSDKLTLPVSDLAKLEKYSGEEGHVPVLSRLGGKSWEAAKERTRKAIVVLVKELIELYARRSLAKGFAFPSDGDLQKEFENAFEYDLTPDQAKAIVETKRDMESEKPMDRLVCGDVGFGKTEVAMRAAFKAICAKKQVAILAPTTILAAQHFDTFSQRFSSWPVRIEALHRFRSPKEMKEALEGVRNGAADILVGTHRLLSKDVEFKDLGLLIVDEEQKFGVKQKERLKELRAHVDVLSLSATPIPRSLHLSLLGARELSLIATPPRNRLPIETRVLPWEDTVVRDAIEAEMSRGGQAFVVHNRISDLAETADRIQSLIPVARVGVAHGQMEEGALERVMSAFVNREFDVLACTAIVESGLDIANANTMIVDRADLFGLSQLYQLRGRVGRSSTQAHCLLISPDSNRFSDDARKKLHALEKFTDLGSGFQIAMRDLEIRGAGNLLGLEQSGHIAAVGFETYCRMVEEAVRQIQGHQTRPPLNPEIEFPVDAFLPEDYIENGAQRTTLYQKIARFVEFAEAEEMGRELEDRFGPPPEPARMLLGVVVARIACRKLGFQKGEIRENALLLDFSEPHTPPREELPHLIARCRRPARFIYGDPLRLRVELNPQRRGDALALTEMAVEVLRGMAGDAPSLPRC